MTSPTLVLIPGAGGSGWYWNRVHDELVDRGCDAVSVDLPGPDPAAGLAEYVDIVVGAAGDREHLVLVGASLGGFTAAAASRRLPVSMLVFVNAMIPNPGETAGDWWANTGQAQAKAAMDERDGRRPGDSFDVATYFLHDVPPEVLADPDSGAVEESDAVFASPSMLDEWPDVPIKAIAGRDDRFFPVGFQRRVALERLGVPIDETPGGHLVALSRPIELTDRLVSYLAE
jgi:pimeloyl-ACP methyl ester carboxylesterase